MQNKLNNILFLLNKQWELLLGISFSLSFFVFVFKPFPLDHIDIDNRILFIFGLGAIGFAVMFMVRVINPGWMNINSDNENSPLSSYLNGLIIWSLGSIFFFLYLKYTGYVHLSSFVVFKLFLICLAPPLILAFHDKFAELMHKCDEFNLEITILQKRLNENEAGSLHSSIDIFSKNRSEKISLPVQDILFIRSADNYAEVNYLNGGHRKKRLLRNTLRDIEFQLKLYPEFVRCHRICIINTNHIVKFAGNCNHHTLMMKGYDKEIPVSRQYFMKIKEAI